MARARPETVGLVVTLLLISVVTLMPAAIHGRPEIDLCLVCGNIGGATAVLNIVLFMPFGFFARLRLDAFGRTVATGLLFSLCIEAIQLVVPGRETALSDLLANTIGAAVGAALALRPSAWLLPTRVRSRIAALAATALVAAGLSAAGPLLDPSAPPGDYYGQWSPHGRTHPTYKGEVLSVTLGGAPLRSRRLDDAANVRAGFLNGAVLHLRYRSSEPTAVIVPVFRVVFGAYGEGEDLFWAGTIDSSLVVWMRMRADEVHVSRPAILLPGALAGVRAGDTVDVRVQHIAGSGFSVAVDSVPARTIGLDVGRSWSLIYDVPLRSTLLLSLVDHLWFLGLALAIGWYTMGWWLDLVSLGVVSAAALWAPRNSDLIATPWTLIAALAAGLAAGSLLRSIAARGFTAWTASRAPDAARVGTATRPPRSRRSR